METEYEAEFITTANIKKKSGGIEKRFHGQLSTVIKF